MATSPQFELPDGRWTHAAFAAQGSLLIQVMARIAKITIRRATPALAKAVRKAFEAQLQRVISGARRIALPHEAANRANLHGLKVTVDIEIPNNVDLWSAAIQRVLAETSGEIVQIVMPPVQSVMARSYQNTSILLGQEQNRSIGQIVARESRKIAERVTAVNETTRNNIRNAVIRSIENGDTFTQTAAAISDAVPEILANRSLTIARTELSNAQSIGAANSFKESETMTYISVIGCEAREVNSPHYNGQSTCNYPDLPIGELDAFLAVGFHPNHTGVMVPSGFRNADGTMP